MTIELVKKTGGLLTFKVHMLLQKLKSPIGKIVVLKDLLMRRFTLDLSYVGRYLLVLLRVKNM